LTNDFIIEFEEAIADAFLLPDGDELFPYDGDFPREFFLGKS